MEVALWILPLEYFLLVMLTYKKGCFLMCNGVIWKMEPDLHVQR